MLTSSSELNSSLTFINNSSFFCVMIDRLQILQASTILDFVRGLFEVYRRRPMRILDLATGPNILNPLFVQKIRVPYELVLTDISPTNVVRGYHNLEQVLTQEQLRHVKVVLVDSADLKKTHTRIPLYHDNGPTTFEPLEKVLQDPQFYFLQSGYNGTEPTEQFASESFDLVIGHIPYSSMGCYNKAIDESVRVLRVGGYHIVREWQVVVINPLVERTDAAMRGARIKYVDDIAERLNARLQLITLSRGTHPYYADYHDPDECVQNGDILKDIIMVHKKEKALRPLG